MLLNLYIEVLTLRSPKEKKKFLKTILFLCSLAEATILHAFKQSYPVGSWERPKEQCLGLVSL